MTSSATEVELSTTTTSLTSSGSVPCASILECAVWDAVLPASVESASSAAVSDGSSEIAIGTGNGQTNGSLALYSNNGTLL
jgi:hypothetical protein